MKRFCLLAATAVLLLAGCSLHYSPCVTQDASCTLRRTTNNEASPTMTWLVASSQDAGTIRVRYHPLHRTTGCVVVEGRLGASADEVRGGRSYPIVLDTGAPGAVFVNPVHVREDRLRISCAAAGEDRPAFCQLPYVRVGEMLLENPMCWYLPLHMERASPRRKERKKEGREERREGHSPTFLRSCLLTFFLRGGTPNQSPATSFASDESVILGLPALRTLSYLLLDNVGREAELSAEWPFCPAQPEDWSRYPLMIREDANGYPSLFVDIALRGTRRTQNDASGDMGQPPVVTQNVASLQLDTGSDAVAVRRNNGP